MVWKRAVVSFCICAVIAALPLTAHAETYSVYTEGTISSTYIDIFEGLANQIGVKDDYVFFRSGQNGYVCCIGDLSFAGGVFSCEEGTLYELSPSSGSSYNATYKYTVKDVSDLTVNTSNGLVFSNLGGYPDFVERGSNYEVLTLLFLFVAFFCYLLRSIFAYCTRSRQG